MKLEAGKRYVRKDGRITGPLEETGDRDYPFEDPTFDCSYTKSGDYWPDGTPDDDYDLVSEYVEEPVFTVAQIAEYLALWETAQRHSFSAAVRNARTMLDDDQDGIVAHFERKKLNPPTP